MTRRTAASSSKAGFTLIEVLVALAIISIVFIALADTSLVSLDYNLNNTIREDAVRIADSFMDEARNTPFDNLASTATPIHVLRTIRGKTVDYSVSRALTTHGASHTEVAITVSWNSRKFSGGRWVPTSRTHRITSMISSGTSTR